jgi:hypothetical protein
LSLMLLSCVQTTPCSTCTVGQAALDSPWLSSVRTWLATKQKVRGFSGSCVQQNETCTVGQAVLDSPSQGSVRTWLATKQKVRGVTGSCAQQNEMASYKAAMSICSVSVLHGQTNTFVKTDLCCCLPASCSVLPHAPVKIFLQAVCMYQR